MAKRIPICSFGTKESPWFSSALSSWPLSCMRSTVEEAAAVVAAPSRFWIHARIGIIREESGARVVESVAK
jgi:hypothetical protein